MLWAETHGARMRPVSPKQWKTVRTASRVGSGPFHRWNVLLGPVNKLFPEGVSLSSTSSW